VRVFVRFSHSAVALINHRCISQCFHNILVYHTSWVVVLLIPLWLPRKVLKRRDRIAIPGNDANEDAPIGYSVNKYALVNMGVIHQWEIFFYKLRGLVHIWRPRGNDVKRLINTLGRKKGLTLLIVLWRRASYSKRWSCPTCTGAEGERTRTMVVKMSIVTVLYCK